MMIPASTSTVASLSVSQDTAQPHADPVIECRERVAMAVLEVFEPAHQRLVDVGDDVLKTVAVGAPGLAMNRVFELLQAFRTRPPRTRLEVISQEVKAARLGGVHDPRLGRMPSQPSLCRPLLHPCPRLAGFRFATAQNHEVVCVSHHLEIALR